MELLRITRQIQCKAVEQRATLIHRKYNRDWGTWYFRPPIDPYLTFPLLQNPGGATGRRWTRATQLDGQQGCSGAGTRWNAVPANILEPERRSGKYRWPQVHGTLILKRSGKSRRTR